MSNQPSTIENIRSTASSAARNVAESIEPSGDHENPNQKKQMKVDSQGTACEKGSFKDQLNKAAYDGVKEDKKEESFLEKGTL